MSRAGTSASVRARLNSRGQQDEIGAPGPSSAGFGRRVNGPQFAGGAPVYRGARARSVGRALSCVCGPGLPDSVGYMDPGNSATDIAGGSRFGYTLLGAMLISNLMAILLQALS